MSSPSNRWIAVGALLGALGVALGAYGAHGLSRLLETKLGFAGDDLQRRVEIFETAVRYQMFHALALVLVGLGLAQRQSRNWRVAAWAFLGGVLVFSGLLFVLTFGPAAWKWLGAIVPIGGLSLIVGWVAMAVGALRGD